MLTKSGESSGRYRGLLKWCLSFVLRDKSSFSSGALLYCGSPRNGQEGRILPIVQRHLSVRNDFISQSPSPSVGSGVKSHASQTKQNKVLSLYMQGNYVEIHTVETLQYRLYRSMKDGTMTNKKGRRKKRNPCKTVLSASLKISAKEGRSGENSKGEGGKEKWKQAFYNFKEKEAVEWTEENIYSGN